MDAGCSSLESSFQLETFEEDLRRLIAEYPSSGRNLFSRTSSSSVGVGRGLNEQIKGHAFIANRSQFM